MNGMEEIHPAIIQKLNADTALMGMITGVYDYVPQEQPFPYVHMGDVTENPINTFGRKGREITVTLSAVSAKQGFKEAETIVSRVVQLMDGQPLDLPSFHLVYFSFDSKNRIEAPDLTKREVPVTFRTMVQE